MYLTFHFVRQEGLINKSSYNKSRFKQKVTLYIIFKCSLLRQSVFENTFDSLRNIVRCQQQNTFESG